MAALRCLAVGLFVVLAAVALLSARVAMEGRQQLELSDQAFHRGDLRAATLHARRAAVMIAPGAPHVDAAYRRLVAIALGAEASGKPQAARAAWRAVRLSSFGEPPCLDSASPGAESREREPGSTSSLREASGAEPAAQGPCGGARGAGPGKRTCGLLAYRHGGGVCLGSRRAGLARVSRCYPRGTARPGTRQVGCTPERARHHLLDRGSLEGMRRAGPLLETAIERFVRHLAQERRASPNTVQAYARDLRQLARFAGERRGSPTLGEVDKFLLREWLGELSQCCSPTSIARKLAATRSFFRYLEREGVVRSSPAAMLASPSCSAQAARDALGGCGGSSHGGACWRRERSAGC